MRNINQRVEPGCAAMGKRCEFRLDVQGLSKGHGGSPAPEKPREIVIEV